jgi:hypothetical protein
MKRSPSLLLLLALVVGCSGGEEASCEGCELSLERGVRLLPGDGVSFLVNTKIVAASNGNLFAAPVASPSGVAMFSPAGALLGTVGRKGSGPGELEGVEDVYAVGDSIYVVEDDLEVEIFDVAGRWHRTLDRSYRASAFWPLPQGRLVVRVGRSFGALAVVARGDSARIELTPPSSTGSERRPQDRQVAVDPAGRVWTTLSSPMDDFYQVEVFGPEGGEPTRWERRLESLTEPRLFRDRKYVVRVADVASPAPDTLMVLLHRSPLDWRPAAPAQRVGGETVATMLSIDEVTDRYDAFLELFDPEERRLVARWPLPKSWIGGFVRPGEIFTIVEREDLELVVQFYRLRIS